MTHDIDDQGEKTIKFQLPDKESSLGRALELYSDYLQSVDAAKAKEENAKSHQFWNTQPVPLSGDQMKGNKEIVADKSEVEIPLDPLALPFGCEWCAIDLEDPADLEQVYDLLSKNYVEDIHSMFRFNYPTSFLKWALCPPGWKSEWHLGIRATFLNPHNEDGTLQPASKGYLIAFISAVPVQMCIRGVTKYMAEVNFLCVHKTLRSKKLSPMLIKEITRRINLYGRIFQAVYTIGIAITPPVSTGQYYHRPIDYRRLMDFSFCAKVPELFLPALEKKYDLKVPQNLLPDLSNLSKAFSYPGFRLMTEADVPHVSSLLNSYLSLFPFAPIFSEADVLHWFLPRQDLLYSFVLECKSSSGSPIEAFISFYSLPSIVLTENAAESELKTGYLFYYAFKDKVEAEFKIVTLMKMVLIIAKFLKLHVFNCLDVAQNSFFFDPLKFGTGDGKLRYYLYNWKTEPVEPEDMAFIML